MMNDQIDVDVAVNAASEAFKTWSQTPGHVRARHLYSIARHVQKHMRLLAVVEVGLTPKLALPCEAFVPSGGKRT